MDKPKFWSKSSGKLFSSVKKAEKAINYEKIKENYLFLIHQEVDFTNFVELPIVSITVGLAVGCIAKTNLWLLGPIALLPLIIVFLSTNFCSESLAFSIIYFLLTILSFKGVQWVKKRRNYRIPKRNLIKRRIIFVVISFLTIIVLLSIIKFREEIKEIFIPRERAISEYESLGYEYIVKKKFDKAIEVFEKAKEIDPNNPKVYLGLVEAYYLQSTVVNDQEKSLLLLDQAIFYAEKHIKISPNIPLLYYRLGDLYEKRGVLEKALYAYEKATNLAKVDKKPDKMLKKYVESYNRIKKQLIKR
jgi:tetratricopeptide (TPR) repeat protein